MKISFKYLILFFAVGMMSFVACSDDDDDPAPVPTPPANGGGGGGGGGNSTVERITSFTDGDTVDFETISVTIDMNGPEDVVEVVGRNSSPTERISIDFKRSFTGTATYPQATEEVITYTKNGTLFIPSSGTLVVNRNDSIVSGTFDFKGDAAVAGSDTITVENGVFYLKL